MTSNRIGISWSSQPSKFRSTVHAPMLQQTVISISLYYKLCLSHALNYSKFVLENLRANSPKYFRHYWNQWGLVWSCGHPVSGLMQIEPLSKWKIEIFLNVLGWFARTKHLIWRFSLARSSSDKVKFPSKSLSLPPLGVSQWTTGTSLWRRRFARSTARPTTTTPSRIFSAWRPQSRSRRRWKRKASLDCEFGIWSSVASLPQIGKGGRTTFKQSYNINPWMGRWAHTIRKFFGRGLFPNGFVHTSTTPRMERARDYILVDISRSSFVAFALMFSFILF